MQAEPCHVSIMRVDEYFSDLASDIEKTCFTAYTRFPYPFDLVQRFGESVVEPAYGT